MAVIETLLQCDLKKPVQVKQLTGNLFSLDNDGNLIGVRVTSGGQPVVLEGVVTGYCILADGQTVVVTGDNTGIVDECKAYIILPQLAYSVPGQINIIIKLTNGSTITTLGACSGYVYRSRTSDEVVPAGTPIPDIATMEEAIRNANTAASSANSAASSANTAASGAENVNVTMSKTGKVMTITATDKTGTSTINTITEPTLTVEKENDVVTVTSTDADGQTSVQFDAVDANEVSGLKNAITQTEMQMEMNYLLNVKGTLNSSTGADVSNNTYFRTDYFPVISGQKCKYNLRTADTYAIIAVYNSSKEKIDTVVGTGSLVSGEYTFAQDGYVRFSCISGNPLKSASIQFEDGQIYKIITDVKTKDEAVNQRISDLTTINFNRFNKNTIISGKKLNHNNADIVNNETQSTTALIPVDPTIHGRVRASQKASEIAVFDSNKSPIAQGNYYTVQNRFAIDITGAAYVQMSFVDANTNYNTLMIAYTDETIGATTDTWNSLFPGIGYVPYGEAIDSAYVFDKAINLRLCDILKNINNTFDDLLTGIISKNDVIGVLENTTGVIDATNQFPKEKQQASLARTQ